MRTRPEDITVLPPQPLVNEFADDEDQGADWSDEFRVTQLTSRTLATGISELQSSVKLMKRARCEGVGSESNNRCSQTDRGKRSPAANALGSPTAAHGRANRHHLDDTKNDNEHSNVKGMEGLQHKGWALGGALAPFERASQDIFSDTCFPSARSSRSCDAATAQRVVGAHQEIECAVGAHVTCPASPPTLDVFHDSRVADRASASPPEVDLFTRDPSHARGIKRAKQCIESPSTGAGATGAKKQDVQWKDAQMCSATKCEEPMMVKRVGKATSPATSEVKRLSDFEGDVTSLDRANQGRDLSAGVMHWAGDICGDFEGAVGSMDAAVSATSAAARSAVDCGVVKVDGSVSAQSQHLPSIHVAAHFVGKAHASRENQIMIVIVVAADDDAGRKTARSAHICVTRRDLESAYPRSRRSRSWCAGQSGRRQEMAELHPNQCQQCCSNVHGSRFWGEIQRR
jgi:hypothetical protein